MDQPDSRVDRNARFLAAYQNHWLERLLLPLLAVGFSGAAMALAGDFTRFFFPDVSLPWWLFWAGIAVALESVYVSSLFVKARTPATLRLLEVGLIVACIYLLLRWSGAGASHPLLSFAVFKRPDVFVPVLIVFLGWYLGESSGAQFAAIGKVVDEVGDQAAATLSWEQESLVTHYNVDTRRASAVRFFTHRVLFYAFVTSVLAVSAIEGYPDRAAAWTVWRWSVGTGTVALLLFGLALQGCVYLYRLRTIWRETEVQVSPHLPRQWLVSTLAVVAGAILIATLLPSNLAPLDFRRTMEWLSAGMASLTSGTPFMGGGPQPTGGASSAEYGGMEPGELSPLAALLSLLPFILVGLFFGGAALLLIGALLVSFFGREWEKLRGAARLPVIFYLWCRETGGQLIRVIAAGLRWGRRRATALISKPGRREDKTGQSEREEDRRPLPSAPAMYIRRLFVLLVNTASKHGLAPKIGQTPLEFTDSLKRELGDVDGQIQLLADRYVEARYSRSYPGASIKPIVRAAWRQVVSAIRAKFGKP